MPTTSVSFSVYITIQIPPCHPHSFIPSNHPPSHSTATDPSLPRHPFSLIHSHQSSPHVPTLVPSSAIAAMTPLPIFPSPPGAASILDQCDIPMAGTAPNADSPIGLILQSVWMRLIFAVSVAGWGLYCLRRWSVERQRRERRRVGKLSGGQEGEGKGEWGSEGGV